VKQPTNPRIAAAALATCLVTLAPCAGLAQTRLSFFESREPVPQLIDVEPVGPEPQARPAVVPDLAFAISTDGIELDWQAGGTTRWVEVVGSLAGDAEAERLGFVVEIFARQPVRIQKEPRDPRQVGELVLSTQGRPLADFDVLVRYAVDGKASTVTMYRVDLVEQATGAVHDSVKPDPTFAAVPGSCEEEAMVRFGSFPYGLPPIRWPEITGCDGRKCVDVAFAWLNLHHDVWRANQMIAVLDGMNPPQREYFWSQPGADENGEAVGQRSSPAYWFGEYDGDRYAAVRETMTDFWNIVLTAKTGSIDLRLQCPDYSQNPGNVCFSNSAVLGHHWVKGWVNFCDAAFSEDDACDDGIDGVDRVMHHEPLHHVFTHINGLKAIRDTISHFHGGSCVSSPTTHAVYCEEGNGQHDVRHFVEYGEGCWHHDKVVQTVDANALFVDTIGGMVLGGEMTTWPKPTDPTPQPPECQGGVGCLCEPTGGWEEADGDYSADSYCPEYDGFETECMATKFNASSTVGICTSCEDFRGPGCECNDLTAPCEKGFCWGDDTGGVASAVGTCYVDPPPSWGCLADCEALLGDGAFCMTQHPDGARCVPYGTTLPEASNCWWDGGFIDPEEGCVTEVDDQGALECNHTSDCAALGYPATFVCDATLRCVAQP
jgi:hypothetical protein